MSADINVKTIELSVQQSIKDQVLTILSVAQVGFKCRIASDHPLDTTKEFFDWHLQQQA